MKVDQAIQVVREARRRISESVGHDPHKLVERYRQLQKRHRDRVIVQPAPPKPGDGEHAA